MNECEHWGPFEDQKIFWECCFITWSWDVFHQKSKVFTFRKRITRQKHLRFQILVEWSPEGKWWCEHYLFPQETMFSISLSQENLFLRETSVYSRIWFHVHQFSTNYSIFLNIWKLILFDKFRKFLGKWKENAKSIFPPFN